MILVKTSGVIAITVVNASPAVLKSLEIFGVPVDLALLIVAHIPAAMATSTNTLVMILQR